MSFSSGVLQKPICITSYLFTDVLYGDIEVDRHFLVGLLDGYLQQRHSLSWCGTFCRRLLLPLYELPDKRVIFVGGRAPVLNRRGIKYMNALVGMYGDMLVDFDLRDASGMLRLPSEEECTAMLEQKM